MSILWGFGVTGGWPASTVAAALVLAVLVLHAALALFCLIATAALPLRHHRENARRRNKRQGR